MVKIDIENPNNLIGHLEVANALVNEIDDLDMIETYIVIGNFIQDIRKSVRSDKFEIAAIDAVHCYGCAYELNPKTSTPCDECDRRHNK